mmetsp:Transcript_75813/g.216085  ORF Transcript_75813/g.216085 Transcript_75813/m.216085 type:complete len:224 (-) Transcript_75813:3085-3756(-)
MRHYAPAKDKGEFDTAWCLAPVGATCVCWGTCLEYTWCDCRYCCKTCCLSWGCKEGCAKCCASGCSKCCACHCCASWCGCLTSATCTLPILAYSCGGVALGIACVACCLGYRRLQQKSVERPPPRSASSHVENALQVLATIAFCNTVTTGHDLMSSAIFCLRRSLKTAAVAAAAAAPQPQPCPPPPLRCTTLEPDSPRRGAHNRARKARFNHRPHELPCGRHD